MVCSSMENYVRDLFKKCGFKKGSSHSKGNLFNCYIAPKPYIYEAANDVTFYELESA